MWWESKKKNDEYHVCTACLCDTHNSAGWYSYYLDEERVQLCETCIKKFIEFRRICYDDAHENCLMWFLQQKPNKILVKKEVKQCDKCFKIFERKDLTHFYNGSSSPNGKDTYLCGKCLSRYEEFASDLFYYDRSLSGDTIMRVFLREKLKIEPPD